MDTTELAHLETQVHALIDRCQKLHQKNTQLIQKNHDLEHKTTLARERIEDMIGRIKKMETKSQ